MAYNLNKQEKLDKQYYIKISICNLYIIHRY